MEKYIWIWWIFEFVSIFLITFLLYRIFIFRERDYLKMFRKKEDRIKEKKEKKEKNKKSKERKKAPINENIPEVRIFILKNQIDLKKVNYEKLAKQIIFMISICMAISLTIAFELFDKTIFKVLIAAGSLIVTTFIGYRIIKLIYKKKGLI